jgi:hypothetical protein
MPPANGRDRIAIGATLARSGDEEIHARVARPRATMSVRDSHIVADGHRQDPRASRR